MSKKTEQAAALINGADKPKIPPDDDLGGFPVIDRFGQNYAVKNGCFCLVVPNKDPTKDPHIIPQCDFTAWIEKEDIVSDGVVDEQVLSISGRTCAGKNLPTREIPANDFYSLSANWTAKAWGTAALLYAGAAKKDNLRVATLEYSRHLLGGSEIPQVRSFAHTGWKVINGSHVFLSNSGALGADGLNQSINVKLSGRAKLYALPAPSNDEKSRVAAALSRCLELVDIAPGKMHLGALAFAAVWRAPLCEAHPVDYSIILLGQWGSGKTELASAMLAYFGAGFNARTVPFSWLSTENSLERSLHSAKDCITVVDDFVLSTSPNEANKLFAKAERLLRGAGNQSGRDRLDPRGSQQAAYYPRGLLVSTNENLPKGASLIGRTLALELARGDLSTQALSSLQAAARDGLPAELMSHYIQWLAPQMAELKKTFPQSVRRLRDEALADGGFLSHPRSAEVYGNVLAGIELFLKFCDQKELLPKWRRDAIWKQVTDSVKTVIMAQKDFQTTQDEPTRFLSLLCALLSSGNGHIADALKQSAPLQTPFVFGWRQSGSDIMGDTLYISCGDLIGWVTEPRNGQPGEIYLNPEATWTAVQRYAKHQGEPILSSRADITKQLGGRGLFTASEKNYTSGTVRFDVRRNVGGIGRRVWVLPVTTIKKELWKE